MPILNKIVQTRRGLVGVIEWGDNVTDFTTKLKKPQKSLVVRLDEKRILVSVDRSDAQFLTDLNVKAYESLEEPTTSIFIPKHLTEEENDNLEKILSILMSNGSISENIANTKIVKSGTFINFSHNHSDDCLLTKAFIHFMLI